MEQNKQIQITFRLADVEEMQFATLCNEWPEGEMQVTNQLNFNCNTANRELRCSVHFEYKKNDITHLIFSYQTTFVFSTESWSAMYQLEGDEWIVPAGLLQHMLDITIGCARGVLAIRTQEKGFPKQILPLVNTAQIIQNNIRFPRTV